MNIATHIQCQKGGGGRQGLANFRQICFVLHIFFNNHGKYENDKSDFLQTQRIKQTNTALV